MIDAADFLSDLKSYIVAQGYDAKTVYRDDMPDQPTEVIGLFLWDDKPPEIANGGSVRYVQVQVRAAMREAALARATALCNLLDSGEEETIIELTADRWCIARPRRRPIKLSNTTASGKTIAWTFYFELAFWGLTDDCHAQ